MPRISVLTVLRGSLPSKQLTIVRFYRVGKFVSVEVEGWVKQTPCIDSFDI